jgi:hypothetical protein
MASPNEGGGSFGAGAGGGGGSIAASANDNGKGGGRMGGGRPAYESSVPVPVIEDE